MAWGGRAIDRGGPAAVGVLAALGYGVAGDAVFQQVGFQQAGDWLRGTLCLSFLVLLPLGIGALTAAFAPPHLRESWPYAIIAPWAVCMALGVIVAIVKLELWVCVVMALPIFFAMSSIGAALVTWQRLRGRTRGGPLLPVLLLAPFLLGPLEARWQPPTTERAVATAIVVEATPEQVWDSFVAVPTIRPEEQRFAWFRVLGLPDPVAATLAEPGADGMRHASYDNGLAVWEPVRVWQPYEQYRFDVQVDPESLPSPLWRAVEGTQLDVQDVEYRIEPLGNGQVRLHLTSRYRLATTLNPYAGLWLDFLLRDFQGYILAVVAGRAEQL
jgi:hypothetical protein